MGPRPEAPEIVRSHYTPDDMTTLQVPPGVTSPELSTHYTHCESTLATDGVVDEYVERLLPAKLALDRVYIKRPTVLYDIRVILRTIVTIVARTLGRQWFPDPPELAEAEVKTAYRSADNREYPGIEGADDVAAIAVCRFSRNTTLNRHAVRNRICNGLQRIGF